MKKRPLGLVAIVVYKSFAALLLMVTAIARFIIDIKKLPSFRR
ncbi:hypothetical protein [Nostoc sphaeroides]|uniref:Membrane protein n=1 Tax=Nostoc sphaeroides CCNUC1 TaxID=2653204 RepID=A0A5P8VU95_9NOSO|nr:hypothetical protein [Nostoc sphaeroides]QFS43972.1 membrane protein [Nostoc sphaeroides CCNUC1]